MRLYNRRHRHYCGIDLHVKTMYICILDADMRAPNECPGRAGFTTLAVLACIIHE